MGVPTGHLASKETKIIWLLDNKNLWEQLGPLDRDKVYRSIILKMMDAGLISKKTCWVDVRLNELINAARAKMRESK